jgi:hypothetical protein
MTEYLPDPDPSDPIADLVMRTEEIAPRGVPQRSGCALGRARCP